MAVRKRAMPGQGSELHNVIADRQSGWVERLPGRWRDFATLARWDRPIGTWLLLLPCWWGQALVNALPNPWLMLLFALGAVAMRGAGCTINDLADRDFDRQVARTRNRPLAAGRISAREAVLFVAAQSLVGLGVLAALNRHRGPGRDRERASGHRLPVHEADHLLAPGVPGHHLQLGRAGRLRRGRPGPSTALPCCSTPPASSGPWATTRSTRTRTRRTTP